MRTINIFKAQPIVKTEPVESLAINFDREVPEVKDMEEWKRVIKKEAVELADALCDTLPQGVTDALLGELLIRKATLFVVPMPPKKSCVTHSQSCECIACVGIQ